MDMIKYEPVNGRVCKTKNNDLGFYSKGTVSNRVHDYLDYHYRVYVLKPVYIVHRQIANAIR